MTLTLTLTLTLNPHPHPHPSPGQVAAALPLEGVASAAGATSAALGEVSTVAREWMAVWGGKIVEAVSPASNRGRGR